MDDLDEAITGAIEHAAESRLNSIVALLGWPLHPDAMMSWLS